jgi:HAE1 family hydrophobic/amphiphilic exporter-1
MAGAFYTQFAVTISVSVLISAFSALTLSPALCSILLKPTQPSKGILARFFAAFNRGFEWVTGGYITGASFILRKMTRLALVFIVIIIAVVFFGKGLPQGFIPEEDQGYILANLQLPDSSSLQQTDRASSQAEKLIKNIPGVESVTTVTGYSMISQSYGTNTAFFFIWLKPWEERKAASEHAFSIVAAANKQLAAQFPSAQAVAFGPPAIPGLGTGSGFSLMLQDRAGRSRTELAEQVQRFSEAARKRPEIGSINSLFRATVPQVYASVDREKALKAGVSLSELHQSIGTFLGGAYVNDFNNFGRLYKVYIQAEPEFRDSTDDLRQFYVKSKSGVMVPLTSLVSEKKIFGPEYTNRFNLFRAAELIGAPGPGYSSTDTMNALEEVAAETLPSDMSIAWNAMSYQERNAPGSAAVLLLGVFFVFLILAAQYESWSLPFSVLLGTPFALLGALGGLWISRHVLGEAYLSNIFAQIGILTLIGLAAKNAILIVEFARQQYHGGMPLAEAAIHAARLRFRPILMTAFAFILGVVPLVLATGAGAEGRKVMGMAVCAGMLVATILGVLLVPALFVLIERLSAKKKDNIA